MAVQEKEKVNVRVKRLEKVGEKSADNKENNKGKTMVQKLLEQQQQSSNLANSR
jgi:hypothetical protein